MWKKEEKCIYREGKPSLPNSKLAAFDFDGTLALSCKGETYASKGFVYAYENTVLKLQQYNKTHTVVIFSNRRGPPWEHKAAQNNLDRLILESGVNAWVFFSIGCKKDDIYRKPAPGMMLLFLRLSGIQFDPNSPSKGSFYCGDAAGPESKCPWNIWGIADIEFAKNCGIPFIEPYQLFKEFPHIPYKDTTKVIMTCGQHLSGWETMKHLVGTVVMTSEKTGLYFVDDEFLSHPEITPLQPLQEGWCYYILGAHPTRKERMAIIEYLKIPPELCILAMYFRGCSNKNKVPSDHLKDFIKSFQLPAYYVRAN
jgi:DNA 3'-phosphatase